MAVAAFEFTDRAVPVVQFGRSENVAHGDARWESARWGRSRWGLHAWEPLWFDATCEIHEITTDTGRSSATDRFKPGTANIVASNMAGLSELIFPDLPPGELPEPLPIEVETFTAPAPLADEPLAMVDTWGGHGEGELATITCPGVAAGDVVYVALAVHVPGSSSNRPTFPDFTRLDGMVWVGSGVTAGIDVNYNVYRRRVLAADVADATWVAVLDSAAEYNWVAIAVRGTGTTSEDVSMLFTVISFTGGPSANITCPTVTTVTDGSLIIRLLAAYHSYDTVGTGPAGTWVWQHTRSGPEWTWDHWVATDGTSAGPVLKTPAGAVGDKVAALGTFTPPELTVGATIAVRPGPYTPPPTPPAPLEEMGMSVRIGIDHATYGVRWLFRGYVDGMIPVYDPLRDDTVRIECIDALGEAGRIQVHTDDLPELAGAPARIRQVLDLANWPSEMRAIGDDSTIMSIPPDGRSVDALTLIAESCGGAVYGDPVTGRVVFKGQDWQGEAASAPPQAVITNLRPEAETGGIPRICPTGFELSWRRSDTTTRATMSSNGATGIPPETKGWRAPVPERYFGIEDYERTLLCVTKERLTELALRHLRVRAPRIFPRVEAVLLDAATADEALDLMTTANFTRPSSYRCQLRRGDRFVFNRQYIVTGIRHVIAPARWTCRLTLVHAGAFVEIGGRWGSARWGRDRWGRTH